MLEPWWRLAHFQQWMVGGPYIQGLINAPFRVEQVSHIEDIKPKLNGMLVPILTSEKYPPWFLTSNLLAQEKQAAIYA